MIRPKTKAEIETMREGGRRHADILQCLSAKAVAGTSSFELEKLTRLWCQELKVRPAFLNYQPAGASYPFPAALCLSLNDEIVHGIPNQAEKILKDGDVVTFDLGIVYEGLITDAAITVGVGTITTAHQDLIITAQESLQAGIEQAVIENPVSNIGAAIERSIRKSGHHRYAIYRGLVGHGVGYDVHEDPNIPNFSTGDKYPQLPEGAVLAIEPMIGLGSPKFILDETDEWTYKTYDGSVSAHVEHTVAVTADGPLILTAL